MQFMQTDNPTSDGEFARIQQMRDAAPDLYEALKALAEDYATINPKYHNTNVYAAAMAALSKVSQQTDTPHPIGQQNEGAES